jgi:predicted RNA polymerase sigma factor
MQKLYFFVTARHAPRGTFLKRFAEAVNSYDKALTLRPNSPERLYKLRYFPGVSGMAAGRADQL